MTEKRKPSSPQNKKRIKEKTEVTPRTGVKKGNSSSSLPEPKKKLSARVAASAQQAKKKAEVIDAMTHTKTNTVMLESPDHDVSVEEDPKNIYFKALGARIAQRAYELYEANGGRHGHDMEDWLEAERQILSQKVTG